jgi:hypothetical protein
VRRWGQRAEAERKGGRRCAEDCCHLERPLAGGRASWFYPTIGAAIRGRADGSRRLATVYGRLRAGERDGYASTMPVKKPIESKPSIKVEMNVANSPDVGEKGSAVVQIKISGSPAAASDRVAKAISEAVRAACQNLAQHLHSFTV